MVDTVSITASEPRVASRESRRLSHRGAAVVAGLMGVLLLGLGVPRLVAAALTIDARAVIWDVYDGKAVRHATLIDAAKDIAAAGRWALDAELEGDRGLLLMHAADTAPPGAVRDALLAEAMAATVSALAAGPGQPSVWARLAFLHERKSDTAAAVAALRMSMLSGAYVPGLMPGRLELGLRLTPFLDNDTMELLRRQVRLMWVVDPDYVGRLGLRPDAADLVRHSLDGLSEDEIAQFQRRYGSRP